MGNCVLGFPIYSDDSVSYTPEITGGDWESDLPLSNLQDRRLAKVARSSDAQLASTRMHVDLETARSVGIIAVPKHNFSKTGAYVRVVGQLQDFLFDYEAGDDITAKGGTFTRASTATYIDRNGVVRTAASGVPRDAHFIGGKRHVLLESARTNICLQSSAMGTTWSVDGTGITVSTNDPTVSAPDATATADKLTPALSTDHLKQDITVANDSNLYSYSLFVKANTSTLCRIDLRFTGGSSLNYAYLFNFATGLMSSAGGNTAARTIVETMGGGWYRITVVGANNSTGNTNCAPYIYPDQGSNTGSIWAWGAQVEVGAAPSSYIATTTVSVARAADSLKFPFTTAPQGMTVYAKITERGTGFMASSARLWEIGNTASGQALFVYAATTRYDTFLSVTAGSRLSQPLAANPVFGDAIETRTVLASTGTVTQGTTINAGSETLGSTSATCTLPGAWDAQTITLNDAGSGSGVGIAAFQSLRVLAGTKTLAEMRASVYDSGWLDAWPSGVTAEDADGINVPFVHLPSSPQSARYWSIQIDDYSNADGYVDLGRLIVAGAFTPTINLNVGAKLGLESAARREESDGGAALYEPKPVRRSVAFVLDHMQQSEAFGNAWKLQRRLGKTGQLFFVFDEDDTTYMHERSFLGVLRELTALEYPYTDGRNRSAFAIVEEL